MRWPDTSRRTDQADPSSQGLESAPNRNSSLARGTARFDIEWGRRVLQAALDDLSSPDTRSTPSARFADYELLDALGRGATATVYRARQIGLDRVVALKVMADADLATEAELQRFRFGAEAAAGLEHPNIAPIYHVGVHAGVPYFAMQLFEGGTLADARARLGRSHVSVIALMAKVARAVHYAHEHGVLHRDLKPANIVLDQRNEPFVVDFGFAKHLDERAVTSKPSIVVGTMGYMAPEQAAGSRSLTFASDIYGLGAILYELLTGEVPFQGLTLAELFERLTSAEPVRSPKEIDVTIDRELELICMKCLEKEPRHRYGTAAELAQDLESWLRGDPISITAQTRPARIWRWCRGHPAVATIVAGAVCVLAATAQVAAVVGREQEQALLGEVRQANTYAAQAKAGQVLFQLRELSSPVARCASDPRITRLLSPGDEPHAQPDNADRLLVECGAKTLFDSVTIINRDGTDRARLPQRARSLAREDVVRRDDFGGAKRLADSGYRSVHVGRVIQEDGQRYVSLSAPVFDADNRWLGVVSVAIAMKAFLESLRLPDSGRQMAVLAGVREREPGDPAMAGEQGVMVLLHGRLGGTAGLSGSSPWLGELTRLKRQAAGRDPFRFSEPNQSLEDDPRAFPVSAFGNTWLAGFAPVGHTGYAVVVQTKYEAALEGPQRALVRLLGWSGTIFVLSASAVLALAWVMGKRGRVTRG